jgi:hypothetical protein
MLSDQCACVWNRPDLLDIYANGAVSGHRENGYVSTVRKAELQTSVRQFTADGRFSGLTMNEINGVGFCVQVITQQQPQ